MTKRTTKKTATGDKVELALARIAANLRSILGRDTPNIIEAGEQLLEAQKLHKKERKFTEWLANLDLSPRSAYNRIAVAKYVKKKGNSATVAEWANVAPGVMYSLADEVYPAPVESEIIKQAKAGIRIDQDRAKAIKDDHNKREREKREREERKERERAERERQVKAKAEASEPTAAAAEQSEPASAPEPAAAAAQPAPAAEPEAAPEVEPDATPVLEHVAPREPGATTSPTPAPAPAAEASAGATKTEVGKPKPKLPQPMGPRDPVLADFDQTVTRLNSFVTKSLATFDASHHDVDMFERVSDFFLGLIKRRREQSFAGPSSSPPPPPPSEAQDPLDIAAQPWAQRNPADAAAKAQIEQGQADRKKCKARGRVAKMKAKQSGETTQMPLEGRAALARINEEDG